VPQALPFYSLSGTIYGERTIVELISSSQTREAAESNFAPFLVATLLIAGSGSRS
jgi:hypothetical protein